MADAVWIKFAQFGDGALVFVTVVKGVNFFVCGVLPAGGLAARHGEFAGSRAPAPMADFDEAVVHENDDGNRFGAVGQVADHQLRARGFFDAAQAQHVGVFRTDPRGSGILWRTSPHQSSARASTCTSAPDKSVQTQQTPGGKAQFDGLTPGEDYSVTVNAVGAAGTSDWSDAATLIVI